MILRGTSGQRGEFALEKALAESLGDACYSVRGYLPMATTAARATMLMMLLRTDHPAAGSNPVIIFMAQSGWFLPLLPTLFGAGAPVLIGWLYWTIANRGSWPTAPK